RQLLTEDTIENNKAGIRKIFDRFLTFGDAAPHAIMEDNANWLLSLKYIDFLRDVGRHFSVNQMIQRDSVKLRLDRAQHLSLLEFNYMVLQAYDFAELQRRHGVRLQMGGSDQWGNIVSGIDLGRRLNEIDLFALTTPLLTTASGAKMGKTAAGAVWLNADQLSPYEYWQYWRNTEDADVGRFLKLFTTLPMDEIARLETLERADINDAKKILATEATGMAHGRDAAEKAQQISQQAFEEGNLAADLPSHDIEKNALDQGIGLLSAFVAAGLCSSNGEARRSVKGGAIRINDRQEQNEKRVLTVEDLTGEGVIKLSLGKKKHVLLKPR
ncbi:MAG: tyrosine--tRNA ligase, partial [Phycisphaerales bacterium]|nr:tyrosine--tRNA ligase [Phycisphaerales bacterium]